MKSFKTKKAKMIVSVIAVMLVACVLTVSMAGCSPSVGVTPKSVFFVGNFQKDVTNEADLATLMVNGTKLVSVKEMLETEGWTLENNKYEVIAGIYALAVTNYSNVSRSAMLIMTDASIVAKNCSILAGITANVGVRSTYSIFNKGNASYTQTISGVTMLGGLGSLGESLRSNFGWNTAEYHDENIGASKSGFTPGAEFYGEDNKDVLKYIMGAHNPDLTDMKISKMNLSENSDEETPDEDEFVSERKYAWSQLDRLETAQDVVANTTYYQGTYGTGWATSDFSNPKYFDQNLTTIDYDANLNLYTISITLLDEYADLASDFTMGALVKDTKNYIELTNAKYTKSTATIEVYGSGLIKSIQKMDTLESNESCKLTVLTGDCKEGGSASNRITYAFSYDNDDCDPLKYVALYWPELGQNEIFTKKKVSTDYKLNLSEYDTFENYKPVANYLADRFNSIYSFDWEDYK
ncbi:MAG: hypothetical protein K2G37_01020 [Clostridia bacterium]|nr:hypothetical protein [Clostridia bacterium]MDE7328905.1 hypothetical protein [Clostridia bacterium]